MYKDFLKSRTEELEIKYKVYKNKLTSILRNCEKKYYENLLIEQKNNIMGTWKVLNEVIKKRPQTNKLPETMVKDEINLNNMKDIVNGFNNFFVNIGPDLAEKIKAPADMTMYDTMGDTNINTMFLNPVTEAEIIKIVNSFKNKNSTDYSHISMMLLKRIVKYIATPLTFICNLSFTEGAFPDSMKTAKIVPIFKSGDKKQFTNYRPVALLPQFSKILERLFVNRLNTFIDKYELLSNSQYGFRKKRSTSGALMQITEEFTNTVEKRETTIDVYIDLKKAFDTIDHNILIKKLDWMGIRGTANNWIKNYLENRQQFVQCGEHKSDLLNVVCGIPQGSILGPKLFILYINDICNVSTVKIHIVCRRQIFTRPILI